jgi:HEAT repeat protein
MSDLTHAFDALLKELPEIEVEVGPEALTFQGERILDNEGSIPHVLHRDGLRRIGFSRGLTGAELEVLVSATAEAFSLGGLGEDVLSALWRRNLPHVFHRAADTTIEAPGEEAQRVRSEIEGLIAVIGSGGLTPEEGEPFHPAPELATLPSYRDELIKELENARGIAERSARVLARAWKETGDEAISNALLDMFDASLVNDDPTLASAIVQAVRTLDEERIAPWLKNAGSEARLRRLIPMLEEQPNRQQDVLAVIDAIGRPAVPALFLLLPALPEPTARRGLAERIVRFGVDDLGPVKELINREPTFLAQEAIFILGRIATPEAQAAIRDARVHPKLHVRLALVESLRHVPAELALTVALDLLGKEEDSKVLAATARLLPRYKTKETADALEAASNKLPDRALPYDTKLAMLMSFAAVNPGRAAPFLIKMVKRGEGILVRRDAEELAAAAIRALGSIRGQRHHDVMEKAAQSRSKLVKEAAREVLQQGETS